MAISVEDRRQMSELIQQRVRELSFKELNMLSNKAKNQELIKIEQTIRAYLVRLENISRVVDSKTKMIPQDISDRNLQAYIIYKQLLTVNMTSILQDGYILIETLRKSFTGKEIEYMIGMEYSVSRGKKELINKTVSLSELLSYAKVDIQWGSTGLGAFKLRASSNKNDFNEEYQKQKVILKHRIDGLTSLYPKVMNAIQEKNMTLNKGNAYEVYQHLRYSGWADHSPGPRNPQELTTDMIIDKYIEIRKGTQSFVSGGDLGLTQFKLLSSSPSIATLGTISKALKLILSYIEKGKSVQEISTNVFSQEFDNLMKAGIDNMIGDIDKELDSLITTKS